MKHVMLDLETLGTEANSVIVGIGAVWFDPHGEQHNAAPVSISSVPAENDYPYNLFPMCFERSIDIQSNLDVGRSISGGTLKWWAEQGDGARRVAFGGETPLREALNDFTDFINMVATNWPAQETGVQRDQVCVWGHGAAFDNSIIRNAYGQLGYEPPWSFRNDRCNRTFLALAEERGVKIELVRVGTFHIALDDALTQAMHMQKVNAALRASVVLKEAA